MHTTQLPVAVIGAGPVGLAAAAHLVRTGQTPIILEAGQAVGASVRQWSHVRFFSPWRYSIDAAARSLLEAHGWTAPAPDDYPTGQDLLDRYLVPLAATPQIAPHLRLASRVVAVTRQGYDKMTSAGRADAPFVLRVVRPDGREQAILARAVIDASGTWTNPNPLGASGIPALGERALAESIAYGIPDVLGARRARYAGRRVAVVGSGHSALNALVDLAELADQEPGTAITWVVRRGSLGQVFGGGDDDALPQRGALGQRVRGLLEAGRLRLVTGFRVAAVRGADQGLVLRSEDGPEHEGQELPPVDQIITTTGFRPDLALLGELRLSLDAVVESPTALAPLIDPNIHSCGTVPPHGVDALAHPERDVYIVGMKSYGRAPTFLLLTGYEQVRSVVAALAGDWQTARDVRLVLPQTGVCSSGQDGGSCGVPQRWVGAGGADARAGATRTTQANTPATAAARPPLEVAWVGAPRAAPTLQEAASCCPPAEQATCCEPADKAECCGASPTAGGCGCQ